jgi:hypothetical protein
MEQERASGVGRSAALGCLLALPGFFGGGMIAVAIAMFVDDVRRCTPPDGLPACGTFEYLIVGGVAGVVLLPGIALWRLHRRRR